MIGGRDAYSSHRRYEPTSFWYLTDETSEIGDEALFSESEEIETPEDTISTVSLEELEIQLNQAIANEDYELASKIRDEINKRSA